MRSFAPPQPQAPVARRLAPSRTAIVELEQTEDQTPGRRQAIANTQSQSASGTAPGSSENTPNKPPRPGWNLSRISIHPSPAIQTKLAINRPGDEFEQEADRIAQQVVRMETPTPVPPATTTASPTIQRKCACGGSCSKCKGDQPENEPENDQEHKLLQRKPADATTSHPLTVPSTVHQVLSSPGVPLDAATRAFMEPRFGHDFSQIRIHADPGAARSAADIQARAYTVGRNVVFAHGEFSPSTPQGRALLAHELVHTVQQTGRAGISIQRSPAKQDATKPRKPEIVKIVAFEEEESGAKDEKSGAKEKKSRTKNKTTGVAYVAYPAHPELAEEAATVPEAVTITDNDLKAGEYKLQRDDRSLGHYKWLSSSPSAETPAHFAWLDPYTDRKTKEVRQGQRLRREQRRRSYT